MTGMMELTEKDVSTAIITMFKHEKEKMNVGENKTYK